MANLPPFDPTRHSFPTIEQPERKRKADEALIEDPQEIASDPSLESSRQEKDSMVQIHASLMSKELNEKLDESEPVHKKARIRKSLGEKEIEKTPILNSFASETLPQWSSRLAKCFGKSPNFIEELIAQKGGFSAVGVMDVCDELARERFCEAEPITEIEITDIHGVYFETALQELGERAATMPVDYVDPQPAYVYRSLFSCMEALQSAGGCETAIHTVEAYVSSKPETHSLSLLQLLGVPIEQRERILKLIREEIGDSGVIAEYNQHMAKLAGYASGLKAHPLIALHLLEEDNNISHVNQTYIMHDTSQYRQWIFKPVELNMADPTICFREQMASLVNRGGIIPVPLTILVQMGGYTGSAQLFVHGAETLNAIEAKGLQNIISKIDLHKIAIFDVLFGNTDRHKDNILLKHVGLELRAFAIDHDQCFQDYGGI